jgi:SAM-dependent methyltransferase
MQTASSTKTFLHVGCGPKRKHQTTPAFRKDEWVEIRLDIDPSHSPDITGTTTDMSGVASGSVDAIFSSHNIEHLYPHEVLIALSEFKRVLKPDGFAVITCPDMKSVSKLIAEDKLTETAYSSPAGPITPIDIIYGHRGSIARGNHFMAHRCGFTEKVLGGTLRAAEFATVATIARGFAPFFDLWAVASVAELSEEQMGLLASFHMPVRNAGDRRGANS